MTVKSKVVANKYRLESEGKTYLMALGLSEKNHIFCFTFMSKTEAWHDAYMALNGPANLRPLKAYDLYEWHDRVEQYLLDKRKRKFDGQKIIR